MLSPRWFARAAHSEADASSRRASLQVHSNRDKVNALLDAMPFIIDTYGLQTKHKRLMKQLSDLNEADRTFSRKKVIVTDDNTPVNLSSTVPQEHQG